MFYNLPKADPLSELVWKVAGPWRGSSNPLDNVLVADGLKTSFSDWRTFFEPRWWEKVHEAALPKSARPSVTVGYIYSEYNGM